MKTAVEFLEEEILFLTKLAKMDNNNNVQWSMSVIINRLNNLYYSNIEKAKEIEKKQIIKAHVMGIGTEPQISPVQKAEQYYNETFKKDGI